MGNRVLLATVLGGIALFIWGSVSHLALGLGSTGIRELPNEAAVLAAMKGSIAEPGFYFFPGMGVGPGATAEQKNAAQKKFEDRYIAGPNGILIYHPTGTTPFSPAKLGAQLGLNLLQALLAALLLSMAPGLGSYGRRIGFFALLGLLMATATNVEYWNWYGFPTSYTLTAMCDKFIGFLVVGLAVGAVIKTDGSRTSAA